MNILQTIIFPGFNPSAPDEMYLRESGKAIFSREKKEVLFDKYGSCTFDTYFNGFMLECWANKAKIETLFLNLIGKGKFKLRVYLDRSATTERILLEKDIKLSYEGEIIDISAALQWQDGMIFFEIISMEDSTIFLGGEYRTSTSARNDIKLGLVITHFNRKQYVLPAMKRISNEILDNSIYKNNIELVVVDNSSNITPEEAHSAHVIANRNLGGSGGFTRGLLYLLDNKTFTHCLFMDDDASCEIESILRTYHLLQYVTQDNFAIAGALLREDLPSVLHEKGAIFENATHKPLKSGMNMISKNEIIASQLMDKNIGYGAWWFFAFKISEVKFYPYPFFVRGDDVLFPMLNKFNIFSTNGIACWGDDFWVKENPLTRYLGFRSTLVCSMLLENILWTKIAKIYTRWFATNLLSYNYGSAEAILLAAEDVMEKGPEYFVKDISASHVREKLASFLKQEKLIPTKREDIQPIFVGSYENKLRKIIRLITLNGFLLPSFLIKNSTVFQHKHFRANFREIFRYKKVYYEYEAGHIGYIATHDKKRFFSLLWRFAKSLVVYTFRYKKVRQEYRDRMADMTSLKFWREIYNNAGENIAVQNTSDKGA